jgi:flagellar motor component MotA
MRKLTLTILITVSLFASAQKRDTTAVLATYQIGSTLMAQSSIVFRVHLDTTMQVVDSLKSTLKNIVKTKKRVDLVYYLIPYADTLRANGKPKLDSLGKPQFTTDFAQYPAYKVSELQTGNGQIKSEADKPKK